MVDPVTNDGFLSRTLRQPAVIAVLGLACTVAACGGDSPREPLPDWSAGYPDAGGVGDAGAALNAFALVLPASVTWPGRLGRKDAMARPCTYTSGDWPKPVDCMLDVNELDLFTLGLKYDIVVPAGSCDFVLHIPYIFANFAIGSGPTQVAYTANADGTYSNEVNSTNGKPTCAFDHSRLDTEAPNCCLETYMLEVTRAATGEVTRSTENWGGKRGDCFYGAGYVEKDAKFDPSGMPMPRYIYMGGAAARISADYAGVSEKNAGNLPLANYYDLGGNVSAPLAAPGANPYYEAYCLDDAEEIRAWIRLTVREWNEEAQFRDTGNPDTFGPEPWERSLDASVPLHDIADWADWAGLAPNNSFPSIKLVGEESQ